ncbi:MAG: IPT/TIG domain-containing protein [Myxococcales bacterium]|nr:IPT/TIG domain-containing protein [Myxococcales bacterium]
MHWRTALGLGVFLGLAFGCDGVAPVIPASDGGVLDSAIPPGDFGAGPPRADQGADMEVADPRFNSVFPSRGELAGGTRLRIVGREFVEGMRVRLGAQDCLELTVENENHMRCLSPAAREPGAVAVEVRWPGAGRPAVIEDAFTYFEPVALDAVNPGTGPTTGGLQVELLGAGLVNPTTVRFGGARAERVEHVDDGRLVAVAPEHPAGVVEVTVTNANGSATLGDAFTYTEPLVVDALEPAYGSEAGGEPIRIRGTGLLAASVVTFGGAEAVTLNSELERTRLTVNTPRSQPGLVDVTVQNTNGRTTLDEAFLFLPAADGPFGLVGAVPRRVPATGGAVFVVGGNGFTDDARVSLDDEPVACQRLSAQALRCTAPPMPVGAADVVVDQGGAQAVLPGGLFFFEEIEVYDVQPPRGAVAGGAVVEIVGRGLRADMRLRFQDSPLEVLSVDEAGERAFARTPPGLPGWVTLVAETDDDRSFLPEAFRYFEPRTRFGGVWGEGIERAVNVTVLDYMTGEPVAGAFVQVDALEGDGRWVGEANAEGQVTVSAVDLALPVAVTAAAEGYEVYTFDRVTHENVTAYLFPHEIEGNPGGQDPIVAPRVSGTVTGLDALEKPLEPGISLVAFVETTHTSLFNRSSLPPPDVNGVLVEDGAFEIRTRIGELAVVVTAAYVPTDTLVQWQRGAGLAYSELRAAASPIAMGMGRFVSAGAGQVVEGVQVHLGLPLDREVDVALDNPSGGARGAPEFYEARPVLDFGAEGYYALDSTGESDLTEMRLPYLPDMRLVDPDITMQWIGVARTETWSPYAMTFHEERSLEDGVLITPFVGTPSPITPEEGGSLGPWRVVEWGVHPGVAGPTEPADANVISLVSAAGLPLWTYVTPGAVTRVQLPPLPEIIQPGGVVPGDMYLYIEPVIVDGRFDYADFTYRDLSRRRSFATFYMAITD